MSLVLFACGPKSDESRLVEIGDFPRAYAQALCDSLRPCCEENRVRFDWTSCTRGWRSEIERRFAAPLLRDNYNAKVATDCVAKVRASQGKACTTGEGTLPDARATCQKIFEGQKPIGSPCTSAAECAPGEKGPVGCFPIPPSHDAGGGGMLPLTATTPVCTELRPTAPGDPCFVIPEKGAAGSCTSPGLFCDPVFRVCREPVPPGSPCVPGACTADGFCMTSGPNAGKCAIRVPLGGACATSEECDGTTRCEAGKCAERRFPGESCTADTECDIGLCDLESKRCLKNTFATTNACAGVP